MLGACQNYTDTGLRIRTTEFVIDGNKATVQGDGYMKLKDGREYTNDYHWYFEFRDGKIYRAKEYLDTASIVAVFGG
jgi:ketosteroid isomerase-like protein